MIYVALCPTEIVRFSQLNLKETTAVVFDILRATSSMTTALEHGASALIPVETVEEARSLKAEHPDWILAGERHGVPPEGFDLGNSPSEFELLKGKKVVMTTTNGTKAVRSVATAKSVLIGSLLNLSALSMFLHQLNPKDLLMVCSGTEEDFSLEDAIGAGALISLLNARNGQYELSDAGMMVQALAQQVNGEYLSWFKQTRNGRTLARIGKAQDIERCSRISIYESVGRLNDGTIECYSFNESLLERRRE